MPSQKGFCFITTDMVCQCQRLMVKFGFSTRFHFCPEILYMPFSVYDLLDYIFFWPSYFVQSYTQYIPLLVSDLDSWLRTPSIYVFDCSAAGIIVNAFIEVFNAVYLLLVSFSFRLAMVLELFLFFFSALTSAIVLSSSSFRIGVRLVDLPWGIVFCLQPVKHVRLFLRMLNFLLMSSHHASPRPSRWHWDGGTLFPLSFSF